MKSLLLLPVVLLCACSSAPQQPVYHAGDLVPAGNHTCIQGPCVVQPDYINGGGRVITGTVQ
jgi:hypothetical protein